MKIEYIIKAYGLTATEVYFEKLECLNNNDDDDVVYYDDGDSLDGDNTIREILQMICESEWEASQNWMKMGVFVITLLFDGVEVGTFPINTVFKPIFQVGKELRTNLVK